MASDPDEYVSLIRGARIEVVASQRGAFDASVTRVDLGKLWMQRGRESLARTFRAVMPADRVILWFLASPQPPVTILTSAIEHCDLAILTPGEAACWRSIAPCEWMSLSLPTEEFRRYGVSLTGKEVLPREIQQVRRSLQIRLARLRRLHRATVDLAETAPDVLTHPEAARGL